MKILILGFAVMLLMATVSLFMLAGAAGCEAVAWARRKRGGRQK